MSDSQFFKDETGTKAAELALWPSIVIGKEAIDREIARLAALPAPADGRRRSLIVHPHAEAPGLGLSPSIQVSLNVLRPGERTKPIRHNSTQVNFCIAGGGTSIIGGKRITFGLHDVSNTPSMATYVHVNDTADVQVRLCYSNAALLEKMNIHVVDENPPQVEAQPLDRPVEDETYGAAESARPNSRTNPFGTFQLTADGAFLMPYEKLINPDVRPTKSLYWKWSEVKAHLDKLEALGQQYVGRRLYLLYNPATGRTNGTTNNLFATMCLRPAKIVDRPHRHTAAAINYYFQGSGHSVVEGQRLDWKAGDLMLSAPGWGIHNHASHDQPVYELTIQDSPLNIAMESLLWQENLRQPAAILGAQAGFVTNRETIGASS